MSISVKKMLADGKLTLMISDSGIGIAKDLLPGIFDVFVQGEHSLDRSKGGLGIGPALVRQLVELHGGDIHAHSEGETLAALFQLSCRWWQKIDRYQMISLKYGN